MLLIGLHGGEPAGIGLAVGEQGGSGLGEVTVMGVITVEHGLVPGAQGVVLVVGSVVGEVEGGGGGGGGFVGFIDGVVEGGGAGGGG